MRFIFLTFSLLGFFCSFSQTGNYFLSHYSPGEDRFDNVCFDIVQGEEGTMYFASRSGVLTFDGRNWDLISGNGAIYSLQQNKGELYWSGAAGFGKVVRREDGSRQLEKLSGKDVHDVFQSLTVDDKLYFVSENVVLASGKDSLKIESSSLTGSFLGIFELFGSVYINTEEGEIFKIDGDKLLRSPLGFSEGDEVIFSSSFQNQYILGLASGKVFTCGENLAPRELALDDQLYADASVVVSGSWVNQDLFVLGTLRGGMIFIQPSTGKTQEIINYNTGLPDNEVFAMMSDKNQSIWAAHEYGFTRVAPYLPFRSFNHYDGLSGNLLCALTLDEGVYVGTSLGLFKLEREEVYDEITYYVEVEVNPTKKRERKKETTQQKPQEIVTPIPQETESKRKGFLRFLKKNKSKSSGGETSGDSTSAPDRSSITRDASIQYKQVKKTEKVLRTAHYSYKKVAGIEAKVTQLTELHGQLIATGLGGAYSVKGLQAKPILEEPVRAAFVSASRKMLFVSTYSDEVRTFVTNNTGWQRLDLLENLNDQISAMVEGQGDELWFYAPDKAYRLNVSAQEVKIIQTVEIVNPTFDEVTGIRLNNEIILAYSQGFFHFDRASNSFVKLDTIPKPVYYFTSQGGVLHSDLHHWNLLGKAKGASNLQLLNLFSNLRFVSTNPGSDDLWLITTTNELYKFYGEQFTPSESGYAPILRAIRTGGDKMRSRQNLELEVDKSAVTFEVVQPDYIAAQAMEYRYQLEGLGKAWSSWSNSNNVIHFPYLPSGDYTLLVQARDIFGKTKDLEAITFEVLPPYWKRPWFYALEFFVFAALVLLSFRLSTRYRIISRLLSLLTIIMLIQFIQTVVGETFETRASPVIDFFMQVIVAFIILPVEGYLRNLMLRSLDSQSGLYKFLSPQTKTPQEEK
jgi:hypothetical protein